MALFKILKGNEANLPSDKHEGWAYVTEKGNMYVDLSNDKRVKIGNRADTAEFADKATGDTKPIRDIYLAKLAQVESTGSKFTFRGITGGGDNAPDLISIPLAGDKAGLISNTAQIIKGAKTFANGIAFPDVSSTTYPATSQGLSWTGSTDGAKIYYEVQASDKGMLIIEARDDTNAGAIFRNSNSKKEVSIINGLVTGAFKGNLTGTASHATSDANGKNIASYVASVLAQSNNRTIRVTKGDGTTNDIKLYFAASSSFGGAANSANVLNINNTENIGVGRMQFFQKSGDATLMPDTNWWSLVRLQHGGYASTGYWTEMAYSFHSDAIKFRRNQNGTKSAWKTIAFTDGTIAKATQAEKDWLGQVIDETYMKYPLTISGEIITMTRGDGVTSTITVPDTKVTQAAVKASDYTNWRPIVWGSSNSGTEGFTPTTVRDQVYTAQTLSVQPSSGTIRATTFKGALKGNADTATNATYAEKDKEGNVIADSYVSTIVQNSSTGTAFSFKGVSANGDNRPNTISIPAATATVAGLVTNAAQTFAGVKTFKNNIDVKGKVIIDLNGNKVEIGSDNKSYFHFLIRSQATTPLTFWFGGPIQTAGNITPYGHNTYDLGSSSSRWKTGYFGSGGINVSGTITDKDANELRAKLFVSTIYANTSTGSSFIIGGKNTAGDEITSLTIPNASTTKAGLVTNVAQTLAGNKTFTGDIYISHATVADMTYNTTNPKLVFSENGGQPVGIVYTDYDSYRSPAGLKIMSTVSNNGAAWLEVEGAFYAGGDIYDKNKDILLATKYIASLVGSQGSTNYTITPKNQDGTNLSNILNVPINLVGSANTSSKIFLVGTTSQNATAQTGYSHDTVYIDSDGFLYDSGNKPSYHSVVTISDTNNYPWHRIARTNEITSGWHDGTILLYISQDYNGGSYGILRVSLRTNNISSGPNASLEGEWITRSGFSKSSFKLALYSAANKVYADLYYISPGAYAGITVKQIQQGSRGSLNQSRWFLTSSNEVSGTTASNKKTSKGYASQAAAQTGLRNGVAYTSVSDTVDASRVNEANYADRALYDWNGNDIRKKYIATLAVKTTNGTTFTFKGSSMEGDELSAVTIPAATASIAGLVTNRVQTWAGNKTLNNDLYVKGKVAVSTTSANGYNLYVNGTSYFVSDVKIKTQLYLEAHGKDRLLFTDANKKVVTGGHYANSSQIGINITNTTTIGDYTLYTNGTSNFADTIYIRPCRGNYCEGLRIYQYGSWSDILLGGNDLTANTGTSANSWFIGNNNGTLNITRNGSSTGTAYLRCVSNKWYINTTSGAEQLNVGGWVGTVGNSGWYSITHGGGWYMADANFIRNYGSKAMSVNIASNNSWGIGSHRLAAVFKGNDHVSILLSTNTLGYGLCVNNNGNWYWGKRASNSETATSKDTYLLQGNTTLVRPSTDMAIGLGQVKSAEFSNAFIRATSTRHLDASGVYSGDMHLYIGYGSNSPTQKTLFYYSTGTHGAAATSRTQFAEINSNGLYALTRFGVNGQNTNYNFYVNGTSFLSGNANVCKVYNSNNYNSNGNLTLTQLAAYNNASCGMIHAATDNPRGAAGWVHVWSQAWSHGVTSSWVSQIALNVNDGAGMWYRTTSGNIAGRAWIRVLDTNNYASVLDARYVNVTGDTMTGALTINTNLTVKSRVYLQEWIEFSGTTGLYSPKSGAGTHFYPNTTSTYGSYMIKGAKGGYTGFLIGPNKNYIHLMSNGTNEGLYNESTGRWVLHYNRSSNLISIGGSTVSRGYLLRIEGKTYATGAFLAPSTASTWLDGQRYERGGFNLNNATDTGSYWPWMRQTNTGSSKWFSFGILNTSFYWIGSATSRTANAYDYGMTFNIANGYLQGCTRVYAAVWNDYAEYRETKKEIEPGRVVIETGFGDLKLSTARLQPGANVVSDTYGFAIGETEKAKTPIAVSGRVLVYGYEDKNFYEPGDAVCTGPNGTVSKMTREEIIMYPERIVGTVSEIPDYDIWGEEDVPVNGRIWIKVK